MKTTIILGAGASSHYGFPTGEQLIDEIIQISKHSYFSSIMNDEFSLYDAYHLHRFGKRISSFDPISIDRFLSMHKDNKPFVELGKRIISHIIISKQNPYVFGRKNKQNWYKYLFDFIFSENLSEEKIQNDDFRILTFNYDLSLEYFFHNRIEQFPLIGKKKVWKLFRALNSKIFHVYGSVYNYEEVTNQIDLTGEDSTDRYQAHIKWAQKANHYFHDEIKRYSGSIKIIGEERGNFIDDEWTDYLKQSDRIFILGFGFDNTNVSLLELDKLNQDTHTANKIYVTNYGRNAITEDKINQLFLGECSVSRIAYGTVYDALTTSFSF